MEQRQREQPAYLGLRTGVIQQPGQPDLLRGQVDADRAGGVSLVEDQVEDTQHDRDVPRPVELVLGE